MVELLLDHLRWLENDERIEIFDDRKLVAGEDWDARLKQELAKAELVLFVVTAEFLRSSYCAKVELKETIRRREDEGIVVMPIIAEQCVWEAMPLARLQALPKDDNLQPEAAQQMGRRQGGSAHPDRAAGREEREAIAARLAEAAQNERGHSFP